ncbi:ankrd29 [Symbiodinium sp. KB8]|nr:ankrd29 [Symbiodinium sp. KB8]
MSVASLAHAIVSQADSRAEEMQKHIATEFADYYVEVRKSVQKGAWVIEQSKMIVLNGAHFEVRDTYQLCRELGPLKTRPDCFASFSDVLNFMSFNGYDCLNPLAFQNAENFLMKIRVPRAFLQANPSLLS